MDNCRKPVQWTNKKSSNNEEGTTMYYWLPFYLHSQDTDTRTTCLYASQQCQDNTTREEKSSRFLQADLDLHEAGQDSDSNLLPESLPGHFLGKALSSMLLTVSEHAQTSRAQPHSIRCSHGTLQSLDCVASIELNFHPLMWRH